jgi:hypothetical protein
MQAPFSDVDYNDWFRQSVAYLAHYKIIQGYPDGTFKPNNSITRAEFATMISGFAELNIVSFNKFPDVEDHWAVGYINSAAEGGWVSGYPDGTFRPEDFITRAEVISVINRMRDRRIKTSDIPDWAPGYDDLTRSHWAYADIIEASIGHEYERDKPSDYEKWIKPLN